MKLWNLNVNKVVAVDEVAHCPLVQIKLPQWQEKIEYWQVKDLNENPTESSLLQLQEKVVFPDSLITLIF